MYTPSMLVENCPYCGANGLNSHECDIAFSHLIGREFSDPALFRAHRLTVDSYCLQHPERYMVSSKSAATHLAGMCWSLEIGESIHLPPALKRFVDGPRTFTRVDVPPPQQRGTLNVTHMIGVTDPDRYLAAAREWAHSTWLAWAAASKQARAWVEEAQTASSFTV